jgi:hypothetical protein
MNTNREDIINKLFINNKLRHPALSLKWYESKNYKYLYDLIFLETNFLNNYLDVTLRERIYYIENDYKSVILCKFCNNKVNFHHNTLCHSKICKNKDCKSKLQSENAIKMWSNLTNDSNKLLVRNKKISLNKLGKHPSKYVMVKPRRIQTDAEKKKRVKSRSWYRPSDETKLKISESNKIVHNSIEFKNRNKETRLAAGKRISKIMKQKISDGTFTPCITNSWTHWKAEIIYNNQVKKFRSRWEAIVYLIFNGLVEYEKIRIPYVYNNENKNYIVDFVDYKNRIIYEVKPESLIDNNKNICKSLAANDWCKINDYKYEILSEKWIIQNKHLVDWDLYPELKVVINKICKK